MKRSKFEPESTLSSKANDIIGLGFDSDSDSNQLREQEHEAYPDTMGPDSESKPFIELFSTHEERFDLQGSRRYGHIPEAIETDDDELLESQGANIRTETYYPEDGGRTVVREGDREWVG